MSRHLNEHQISVLIAGEQIPEAVAHLENCALCKREIEQLENVLGHFRGTVREWSDIQFSGRLPCDQERVFGRRWAHGGAIALLVLLFVAGYRFPARSHTSAAVSVSVPESDTVLLNHVKADISRSIPPGMETLLGLSSAETTRR